ncbi:MAG: PAAR-like domain-containing protein, partial [Gammaproteobacteria bacterium]
MHIEKNEVISTVDSRRIITVDSGAEIRTVEYCMMPDGSIQAFDNVVPITAANTINADYDHFINDQATCTQDSIVSCSQFHPGAVGGVKSGTLGGACKFLTGKKNFRLKGSPVLLDGDLVVTNNGNSEVGSIVHPGRYRPIKGSQIEYAPLKPDPEFEYLEVGTHQLHLKVLYPNGKPVLLNTCIVELKHRGFMPGHRVTGTKLVDGEGKIFLTKTEFYESDLVFDRAESICYVSKDKKIGYPTHRQIFDISKLERTSPTEAFVEVRILPDAMMKDFSHGKTLKRQ